MCPPNTKDMQSSRSKMECEILSTTRKTKREEIITININAIVLTSLASRDTQIGNYMRLLP